MTTKPDPRLGDTAAVERRLRAAGESLGAYLRRADLNYANWHRWRHKTSTPRPKAGRGRPRKKSKG